jgi:hypothetical protein
MIRRRTEQPADVVRCWMAKRLACGWRFSTR